MAAVAVRSPSAPTLSRSSKLGSTGLGGTRLGEPPSSWGPDRKTHIQLPPVRGRPRQEVSRELVVGVLRSMDYWKVIEYWRLFDKNGSGAMDRVEFVGLLNGMNLGANSMTKNMCGELFDLVDMDGSGELELEEFLGWVFSLHAAYCGAIRSRLGEMNPLQVEEYFRRCDGNHSGSIDRAEFGTFVKKFSPDSNLSRVEINELFSVIDIDCSGEIDASEFLNWVYPPEDKAPGKMRAVEPPSPPAAVVRPGRTASKLQRHRSLPALAGTTDGLKSRPLKRGMQPIPLEFTVGPDFRPVMAELKKAFQASFGDSLKVRIVDEPPSQGCRRLVVQVGRGIVLWDRTSMSMHRDDPFVSFESSRDFVLEKLGKNLSTLLKATYLARRRGSKG